MFFAKLTQVAFFTIDELKESSEQETEAKRAGIPFPETSIVKDKIWVDKTRCDLDSQIYLLLDCFMPENHIIPLLNDVYTVFDLVQKSCRMRSMNRKFYPKVGLLPIRKDALKESKQ